MTMPSQDSSQSSLSGQLLVAMPQMSDPRFARTVVYLCAHSADGAMGLVVNRLIDSLSFESLLAQLGVEAEGAPADMPVHFGGPVESSRGFVLHTSDYHQDSTLVIDTLLEANEGNPIVYFIASLANWFAWLFKDMFTVDDGKLRAVFNYGLAALVYLFIGALIRGLFRRVD